MHSEPSHTHRSKPLELKLGLLAPPVLCLLVALPVGGVMRSHDDTAAHTVTVLGTVSSGCAATAADAAEEPATLPLTARPSRISGAGSRPGSWAPQSGEEREWAAVVTLLQAAVVTLRLCLWGHVTLCVCLGRAAASGLHWASAWGGIQVAASCLHP